jgi:hypothetical protein
LDYIGQGQKNWLILLEYMHAHVSHVRMQKNREGERERERERERKNISGLNIYNVFNID